MAVQKAGWNFAEMAAKQSKKLMSVPLKDKATAKILWNDNAVDCYVMKKGKLVEGRGYQGPANCVLEEFGLILDKLQEIVEPGFDILKCLLK